MTTVDQVCALVESNQGVDLSPRAREYLVGSHTGWPAFWPIPREGRNAQECFWRQYNRVVRRVRHSMPIGDGVEVPYPGRKQRKGSYWEDA